LAYPEKPPKKLISPEVELPLLTKASQECSDYLLLIQARLYEWSGTNADRAKRPQLSEQTVANLMKGKARELSLSQLKTIARKSGITARRPCYRESE